MNSLLPNHNWPYEFHMPDAPEYQDQQFPDTAEFDSPDLLMAPPEYLTGQIQGSALLGVYYDDLNVLQQSFGPDDGEMQSESSALFDSSTTHPGNGSRIPVLDHSVCEQNAPMQDVDPIPAGTSCGDMDPSQHDAHLYDADPVPLPPHGQGEVASIFRWVNGGVSSPKLEVNKKPSTITVQVHGFNKSFPLLKSAREKMKKKIVGTVGVVAASRARREPTADDRFKCQVCGATFTRRFNLQNHHNSHLGLKPHKACCGKSFVTNSGKKRHQQKCSKCQETTAI